VHLQPCQRGCWRGANLSANPPCRGEDAKTLVVLLLIPAVCTVHVYARVYPPGCPLLSFGPRCLGTFRPVALLANPAPCKRRRSREPVSRWPLREITALGSRSRLLRSPPPKRPPKSRTDEDEGADKGALERRCAGHSSRPSLWLLTFRSAVRSRCRIPQCQPRTRPQPP